MSAEEGRAVSGAEWLASAAANPAATLALWDRQPGLVGLPVGVRWDVAAAELHRSVQAMQWLQDRGDPLGPVLACTRSRTALWLVPAGETDKFAQASVELMSKGAVLLCPAPDRFAEGRGWLQRPDGSGTLSDPVGLVEVLRGETSGG